MFTPIKVNGRYFDFTSVRASGLPAGFDSSLFTAHLVGLSFSEKITPTLSRGVHGIPLPRGRGYYQAQASIEVVWDAWDAFTKRLASQGINGYSDYDFTMLLTYKTQGKVSEIRLMEASLLGPDANHSSGGQNGLTAKVEVYVRYILTNGVCAYPLDLDQDLTNAIASGGVIVGV